MPPRILLSAGEASGDLHGASLARALRRRWPDADLYGLGGPRMADEGVRLMAGLDKLAVMGFTEVLAHLPYFIGLFSRMRAELDARPPDLVVPIDYPGFNLRLARAAHGRGVPVLYYIAPQVWAWHRSRMRQLAEHTDRLAVILPFEEELFRAAGADAVFVGHPLLDNRPAVPDRAAFAAATGIRPEQPVLALFPGSRAQEVRRHFGVFAEAAELVRRHRPDVQPVVARPAGLDERLYAGAALPRTADADALLAHADAALVKSGTGTLQAALAGTPLVVAYRTSPLTFALARRLVRVPHVGLVNLVAGERAAPEFLQDRATPAALAAALLPLLDRHAPERDRAVAALARVRAALDPGGADLPVPPTGPADAAPGPASHAGAAAAAPGSANRVAALAADLLADA
ncbi:MAG: lipid-A-disaccharide synthase [Gemmatimonadota bacterium]